MTAEMIQIIRKVLKEQRIVKYIHYFENAMEQAMTEYANLVSGEKDKRIADLEKEVAELTQEAAVWQNLVHTLREGR